MIVITSAAYVGPEFQAEFGKLPPAFLPVANKRLFILQAAALRSNFPNEQIWLTIPEDYSVSKKDTYELGRLNLNILPVPEGLTLAESVLFSLNIIGVDSNPVRLLHGDTYILDIPHGNDTLALSSSQDFYNWEVESSSSSGELVWCGFFSFSDAKTLIKSLTVSKGNFVQAVRNYSSGKLLERVTIDNWYDLGHINTFYKARAKITTQRSFNELRISDTKVFKTGSNHNKISAESNWFFTLPSQLKSFVPQLIDHGDDNGKPFYILEFLYLAPLNELLVNGDNPLFFWKKIFHHLKQWFNACSQLSCVTEADKIDVFRTSMISNKSVDRLTDFCTVRGLSMDTPVKLNGQQLPSLKFIMEKCISLALSAESRPGILHGDLCFSNILYDSRSDMLKLLDPRAMDHNGEFYRYGDLAYDVAKLTHSIIGLYDHIIAGAFTLSVAEPSLDFQFNILTDERISKLQKLFLDENFIPEVSTISYMPLTVLLFLSMLPLHADNELRQTALLANALRLYSDYLHEAA